MGNPVSKTKSENLPAKSIETPQKQRILDVDPRSPSVNIVRTPIEVLTNAKNRLNGDTSTSRITCMDPRSPTVEFTRTPIVVEGHSENTNLFNKHLRNVCKQLETLTPTRSDITKHPKLLDSSPISSKDIKKRNSVIGLLQTNIDYIETDLDAVILKNSNNILKAKFLGIELDCAETNETMAEASNENGIEDPRLPVINIEDVEQSQLNAVEQTISSDDNKLVVTEGVQICQDIGSEPQITDMPINHVTPVQESNSSLTKIVAETDIEDKVEDNLEVALKMHDMENKVSKSENINSFLYELDKKLTNLIYEDKTLDASPKIKTKLKDGNRTPLGNKNNNGVNKLKVHDKPTLKSNYAISKIPVFKEKKSKGQFQCENTPPVNRNYLEETTKIKKSQWDADKTLVI